MAPAKSVVITGASTGIGAACALHLDQLGWRVFAGVRKQADAEAIRAQGSPRLTPISLDVTDTVSISTAVEQQGGATREIARNIQSVAAGSNEISAHIGGVTTAAAATGKAASEVLASARELDTQSGMLRSAVDDFLVKVRAA